MMSDRLTRQFRVQLTTAMDSVLRKAVFEAIRIFENVLYNYQMELAQKREEAAKLKVKLQKAELQIKELTDSRSDNCMGAERNQTQNKPVVVVDAHTQTSEVPGIIFEVPGDSCAPAASEIVFKQEHAVCPSVSNNNINLQRTRRKKSERISTLNEKLKHSQERQLPILGQGSHHPPVRKGVKILLHESQCPLVTSDVKILLRDLKQGYPDLIGLETCERRKRNNSVPEKEDGVAAKLRKEQVKSTAPDANSAEPERMENHRKEEYVCKHCLKVFKTKAGRDVHMQFHNRCQGCKKRFQFGVDLKCHKQSCRKLKLLVKKGAKSKKTRHKTCTPQKIPVIPTTACANASGNNGEGSPVKLSETYHNFDFSRLRKRMEACEIIKPYHCSVCSKMFSTSPALRVHMKKTHKNYMNTIYTSVDLGWTEPLEDIEDNEKDVTSPKKNANRNQDSRKI